MPQHGLLCCNAEMPSV